MSISSPDRPESSPAPQARHTSAIEPPRDAVGIIKRLGPGLIIAASIVGSGELIGTTKTGAQAGIALLWLIIIGCLIKVFAQIEFGRYAISEGETTLAALDRVPGPRLGAGWLVWCWLAMAFCTIGQLGGIVGGVGQSLAITFPITGDYNETVQQPSGEEIERFLRWQSDAENGGAELAKLSEAERTRVLRGQEVIRAQLEELGSRGQALVETVRRGGKLSDPYAWDDKIWSAVIAVMTAALLFWGRYGLIQTLSTILVVAFTFITIGNVVSLQGIERWRISLEQFWYGLSFHLPESGSRKEAISTALKTFGIIGVGATELVAYPYWCLEKGYARFAGPRAADAGWGERARGWIRVMKYDAFLSMVIYTVATLAFFLMGVAVLHSEGRDPEGMRMVSTLAAAYAPVFGDYAKWLFLIGAFAVLYSTYLVANAGNARMFTDGIRVIGLIGRTDQRAYDRLVRLLSVVLPLLCLTVYVLIPHPVALVLLAGFAQATMLPLLGMAAIYLRYTRTDPRLHPGPLWDVMLILSFLGLAITGGWGIYEAYHSNFVQGLLEKAF